MQGTQWQFCGPVPEVKISFGFTQQQHSADFPKKLIILFKLFFSETKPSGITTTI